MRCKCHFFSFGYLMVLWSAMLFTVSFYPLFTFIFLWLWLFLVLCCMFSCYVSLVLVPAGTLFKLAHCGCMLYVDVSGFQIVLECLLQDLSFCVHLTDPRSIAQLWSVLSLHACCSWWSVILSPVKCFMFDLLLWLWCPFLYCTMGPWSTIFLLSCYSSSYGNKIKISGNIILVHFVCLLMNAS